MPHIAQVMFRVNRTLKGTSFGASIKIVPSFRRMWLNSDFKSIDRKKFMSGTTEIQSGIPQSGKYQSAGFA
jgi:hypothetical protein